MTKTLTTRAELTFKHNLKNGRHGWIRLTPAYSVKVVNDLLRDNPAVTHVLEPFSGTATTGLVCAESGIRCDLFDINPFLIWLAEVKTANYTEGERAEAQAFAQGIVSRLKANRSDDDLWLPPISNIERWWSKERLLLLAQIHRELNLRFPERSPAKDLLLVAFCRVLIEWSAAAFNHQSMSFKQTAPLSLFAFDERQDLLLAFIDSVDKVIESAAQNIPGKVKATMADSRNIPVPEDRLYDCLITSPPYPNRMSYIRELRPYMYWLGYLKEAREAGEMDWQAIGGTWGIATSRVEKWQPDKSDIRHDGFYEIIDSIARKSRVLANYVHKYFVDMLSHLESARGAVAAGGKVFYIVGNSKFYDTIVPVEEIYASLLKQAGFEKTEIQALRKRNSKKELRESVVSAVRT
ncbi:MAG: hypothetical protein AB1631_23415 [Acidobacteriota bacterium]